MKAGRVGKQPASRGWPLTLAKGPRHPFKGKDAFYDETEEALQTTLAAVSVGFWFCFL
jgi:hypothetical protein